MARERTGLNQSELARRLETDRTTVWRWENGRQKPEDPEIVVAFARETSVDLGEALAAAGLVPNVVPPTEPSRQPDEERDLILSSNTTPAMKARMLLRLEELRRQDEERIEELRRLDKQRRLETIRFMLRAT
ncbi:MAG TPA: helix-turn-helix domain-containing protein [Asanoa sp.]|nr:helix-turn-helix domain-containing protein [Asanoa sp.]